MAEYANSTSDSILFLSYGSWRLQSFGSYDNSWISLPLESGLPGIVAFNVEMQQNTTNAGRWAAFEAIDRDHPNDARCGFALYQFATRGDGSLGSAADVKAITGTDGTNITMSYDRRHRPTALTMMLGEQRLKNITISYNDIDSVMQVTDGSIVYRASYGKDCQPMTLFSDADTIGYFSRFYPNGMPVSFNYLFNYEHHKRDMINSVMTFRFWDSGVSLDPDSLHNVDSLYVYKEGTLTTKLGMSYSDTDNRRQSVDANQLLLGTNNCDPYLLLSLFRYARSSSVVEKAIGEAGTINVKTTLNADKSISTMTVSSGETETTYTFEY